MSLKEMLCYTRHCELNIAVHLERCFWANEIYCIVIHEYLKETENKVRHLTFFCNIVSRKYVGKNKSDKIIQVLNSFEFLKLFLNKGPEVNQV